MNRYRHFIAWLIVTGLVAGCQTRQTKITGEPIILGIDPLSGAVVDRDVLTQPDNPALGAVPHKGEMVAIVLNNVFVKYLDPLLNSRVLVYAEVYDDASDDPTTAVTRVLFEQAGQPAGVNAGLSDRLLYGPTPYKGFPIRIKLFVVELAKEQKETVRRIIDAVGTIASTARPEAAPAVGLVVQAARLVNELTEDAFELRVDLTLYPVGSIGTVDMADPTLAAFNKKSGLNEPIQRQERPVAALAPLRSGSKFVVIKRELGDRFGRRDLRPEHLPSVTAFDWTQEGFLVPYTTSKGQNVTVQEFLRFTGGYLNWFVSSVPDEDPSDGLTVEVVPGYGPNRGVKTVLTPGIKSRPFDDQTYAVLSVVTLPEGLDQAALAAASRRDRERLGRLLDNPGGRLLSERIGEHVDAVAKAVKTILAQREIAQEAAEKASKDPAFRSSPAYPAYWASQLLPLTDAAGKPLGERTTDFENVVAHNTAILPVLREIVDGFPRLDPRSLAQMGAARALADADFKAKEGQKGLFTLNDTENTKKLLAAARGEPAGGGGGGAGGGDPAPAGDPR